MRRRETRTATYRMRTRANTMAIVVPPGLYHAPGKRGPCSAPAPAAAAQPGRGGAGSSAEGARCPVQRVLDDCPESRRQSPLPGKDEGSLWGGGLVRDTEDATKVSSRPAGPQRGDRGRTARETVRETVRE